MSGDITQQVDEALVRFLEDKAKLSVFEDVVMKWSGGGLTDKDVIIAYNRYRSLHEMEDSEGDY